MAHRAALSTVTLNMIENEIVRPRDSSSAAIRAALESGGVEFLYDQGEGIGVQFAHRGNAATNCSRVGRSVLGQV